MWTRVKRDEKPEPGECPKCHCPGPHVILDAYGFMGKRRELRKCSHCSHKWRATVEPIETKTTN